MAWEGGRSAFSFIIGIILLIVGLVPLLNQWGILGFQLPEFVNTLLGTGIIYILAFVGLFTIIDGFMEGGFTEPWGLISIVIGLIVLVLGIIPLLASFGVISFSIPFLTLTVYKVIFSIEGIVAIIGAFAQQ